MVERYAWDSGCHRHSHVQHKASNVTLEFNTSLADGGNTVCCCSGSFYEPCTMSGNDKNCFNSYFQNSITYPQLISRQTK